MFETKIGQKNKIDLIEGRTARRCAFYR